MEFKTLNEIEWEYSKKAYDYNIKEEVIKWYHRSDGNKHKFIREFFNITEEECFLLEKTGNDCAMNWLSNYR